MVLKNRMAGVLLALSVTGVSAGPAQSTLVDLMLRHGVPVKDGSLDAAFDSDAAPTVPVSPGSFAAPLAVLATAGGAERIAAAYAFGILAGRSGRAAAPQELAAAGQTLIVMIGSDDRRSRVAGARVAGRVFAAPYDRPFDKLTAAPSRVEGSGARPIVPAGMTDGIFAMLNRDHEIEQLAAMDALGLLREPSAVAALTERYHFYRAGRERGLAGGALEALARIGDPSSAEIIRLLVGDQWAAGNDATALAVAFARERMLKDGSIAVIQHALDDKSRRSQARGYLAELGAPTP
jgi:hypothetical protein